MLSLGIKSSASIQKLEYENAVQRVLPIIDQIAIADSFKSPKGYMVADNFPDI